MSGFLNFCIGTHIAWLWNRSRRKKILASFAEWIYCDLYFKTCLLMLCVQLFPNLTFLLPKFCSSRNVAPSVLYKHLASNRNIRLRCVRLQLLLFIIYNLRLRGALTGFSQVGLDFDSKMASSWTDQSWDCKGWVNDSTVYLQWTFW